jgi:hypothetical protein
MLAFAQKQKSVSSTQSPRFTKASRPHFSRNRKVQPILDLQRTIGNQAVQRLVQSGNPLAGTPLAGNPILEAVSHGKHLLSFGARGPSIRKLQETLINVGFALPRFGPDGEFGSETKSAVLGFQRGSGLVGSEVDGIVGPITIGLLARAFATNVVKQKEKGGCEDIDRPIDDSEPVFMCSAPLVSIIELVQHAFFRVGSKEAGCGPTYSLFPVSVSKPTFLHGACVQGRPIKNQLSELKKNASCVLTSLKWSCLESESSQYPWGFYCAFGPNSNTYVGVTARSCGDTTIPPQGKHPGFDSAKPKKETASKFVFAMAGLVCGPDPFCTAPKGEGH